MVGHGGDEAQLTFEAWHFKCLFQNREKSEKYTFKCDKKFFIGLRHLKLCSLGCFSLMCLIGLSSFLFLGLVL